MADTVEQQDIRGLDVDKAVKGFALIEYKFKKLCNVSKTTGDSIRWYQETSTDLTATTPAKNANISPLSTFPTLEPSWTRNTSYVKKYANEGFISMEDIVSADIDVLARTLLRLTRAVVKQVDTRIYNVLTESQTPTNIQTFATTAIGGDQWDAASDAGDPVKDLLHAQKLLMDYGYDAMKAVIVLHPVEYRNLITWIMHKGEDVKTVADDILKSGRLTSVLGMPIIVSPNAVTDKATVCIPGTSITWKSHTDTTAKVIDEPGIGKRIRVWEIGEAILTDPKSVVFITDTVT